jgi:hypothetical protein
MEHQTLNELWKACFILCDALTELRQLLCEFEAAQPTERAIDGIHGIKITGRELAGPMKRIKSCECGGAEKHA